MTEMEHQIRELLMENFTLSDTSGEIDADTDLISLGISSIQFVRLIVLLEDIYQVVFPADKLVVTETNTLAKIRGVIEREQGRDVSAGD